MPVRRSRVLVSACSLILFASALAADPLSPAIDWVSVLEAQGEFDLAWERLRTSADSLGHAPVSESSLQRSVRLLLRRRQYAAAWDTLQRRGQALDPAVRTLLHAVVALRLDQPSAALAYLDAGATPSGLSGFAQAERAEALRRLGRWDEARNAATAAAATPLPTEIQRRLRVIEGQASLALGDMTRLRSLAPRMGEDAKLDDRTGLLLLQVARSAWRGGEAMQAQRWLLELLAARPAPAESAFVTLQTAITRGEWNPIPDEILVLARYEDRTQRPEDARRRLQASVDRAGLDRDAEAEMWVTMAESFRRQGRTANCLSLLEAQESRIRGTRSEPEYLRVRGRAVRSLGDETGIIANYGELAQRFPTDPNADDALYEVGWRYEIIGDFERAAATFAAVQRDFPQSPLTDDAAFREALCALRAGDFSLALQRFTALESEHPSSALLPRSIYWRAWIAERRGSSEEAHALRLRLQRDHDDSYYAVLAGNATGPEAFGADSGATPLRTSAGERPPVATGYAMAAQNHARYTEAIATLRRQGCPAPPSDFTVATALWRFCLDYGLATEAQWETRRLEQHYAVDAGALLELLAANYSRGAHDRLVRLSFMLSLLLPEAKFADAIEVLRYPAPLSVSIEAASTRHGLSHAVILGLIRQESAFDPRADSRVGARGLMQLMPAVGNRLARQQGNPITGLDELYDPAVNIELGCSLFAEEMQRAQDWLPQALAAYNAGSEPAEKWRRRLRAAEPPELYLDLAEYLETRNYMDRVLGGAAIYRRVYGLP